VQAARRYHQLSLVLGTLLAFAAGLVGPTLAHDLAQHVPSSIGQGLPFGLACLFLMGVVAGAFGRGIIGFLALVVGIVFAAAQAQDLLQGSVDADLVPSLVLAAVTVGYVVARAVDPFWGSEPPSSPMTPVAPDSAP
jgi:hypothetical protein